MWEAWASDAPEKAHRIFYFGQIGLGLIFLAVLGWLRNRETPSRFRPREAASTTNPAEHSRNAPGKPVRDELAEARIDVKARLALPGIVLDGRPHEVLGVPANASAAEVQKAWKDLMKRYHPDKVGRPGTREWIDAQKIAEAINRAKEEMISRRTR